MVPREPSIVDLLAGHSLIVSLSRKLAARCACENVARLHVYDLGTTNVGRLPSGRRPAFQCDLDDCHILYRYRARI